jgi:hypothetical protein
MLKFDLGIILPAVALAGPAVEGTVAGLAASFSAANDIPMVAKQKTTAKDNITALFI